MIESFSCGPVAFIENGIERFMKDSDGMIPAAVWLHPEHLVDVQRELGGMDTEALRLMRLEIILSPACRVPILLDHRCRWYASGNARMSSSALISAHDAGWHRVRLAW